MGRSQEKKGESRSVENTIGAGVRFVVATFFMMALTTSSLLAQYSSIPSRFDVMPNRVNPAFSGIENAWMVDLSYQARMMGFKKAPSSTYVATNGPLGESVGFGLSLLRNEKGPEEVLSATTDLAVKFKAGKSGFWAFGLRPQYSAVRLNLSGLNPGDIDDPLLKNGAERGSRIGLSTGLALQTKRVMAGLSVNDFYQYDLSDSLLSPQDLSVALFGSYSVDLSPSLRWVPGLLISVMKGQPIRGKVMSNFVFKDNFGAGIFYSGAESLGLSVDLKVKSGKRSSMLVYYAFGTPMGDVTSGQRATHEVGIRFRFGRKEKAKKEKTPASPAKPASEKPKSKARYRDL